MEKTLLAQEQMNAAGPSGARSHHTPAADGCHTICVEFTRSRGVSLMQCFVVTEGECKDCEPLPKPPQDGWIVVGVVFTSDDILTGIAFAEVER
jgi:hypothetical protein